MKELILLVEEAAETGDCARALSESIFTEADELAGLRDAVRCHFAGGKAPAPFASISCAKK